MFFARHCGLEANTVDLELFHEPVAHAFDHVVEQRAAQAVQRARLGVLTLAADQNGRAFDLDRGAAGQFPIEFAFRAFDMDLLAFTSTFTFAGMVIGCFPMRDMVLVK